MEVEKDWIDYNGHMNMAYYNVLFDRCADEALDLLGIGASYARERQMTIYTAEVHVCYVRELHLADKVAVTFQLIDHDEKRLRGYQEIRHAEGWLAATSETLSLHIDMAGPKVAAFPSDVMTRIEAMRASHATLPLPERAGRSIGIKRKSV
jgi:acyl-CoA thioester hydrolase